MPEVARYDGSTGPSYIEAIAPMWIIEQKRGWAGLQALTPNYLRISDVKKRALEYILGLDVLSPGTGQVVFATSETGERLASMLESLDHHTIELDGKVLQPLPD